MPRRLDNMLVLDMLQACDILMAHPTDLTMEEQELDVHKGALAFKYITILGEAANRLSEEFTERHPDLPFQELRGIRNRIVHGYYEIDSQIL